MSNNLSNFFNTVTTSTTFEDALEQIKQKPNIALLDIELNSSSGLELAQEIKQHSQDTKIIFISGFSHKEYLFKAIKLQVVDYLTKPVTLDILLETFSKIIHEKNHRSKIKLDDNIYFDYNSDILYNKTNTISLGAKERLLLKLFLKNQNQVINKTEIQNEVWPNSYMTESGLKNLLFELRKKIGKQKIKSIPGSGWLLEIASN
jgi:DNA-binding response OmpR family regulator